MKLMNRLSVHNLNIWKRGTKSGEVFPIIIDVTFSVDSGQVLGILGENAAGKSSILWALAGFIPVAGNKRSDSRVFSPVWGDEARLMSGKIEIDGIDVTTLPSGERNIGLVPQNLYLYPNRSVYKNISFSLENADEPDIQKRVALISERFSISNILWLTPEEISGGQQQRVAVARAIVKKPKLALFDEALSSADPLSKSEFIPYIRSFLQEYGGSAVYVTHDPEEAALFCDKVVILKDGIAHQAGTPAEVFQKPSTIFVARFFSGFTTFVTGNYDPQSRMFCSMEGQSIDLGPVADMLGPVRKKIHTIGFRPLGLSITEPESGLLSGSVIDSVFLNNRQCVRFAMGKENLGVAAVNGKLIQAGGRVGLVLNENHLDDIIVFDGEGRSFHGE